MNLEQIKDEYAQSKGYTNWFTLVSFFKRKQMTICDFLEHENEVMIIAQKECLKRASENAEASTSYSNPYVISESITNENNIIK